LPTGNFDVYDAITESVLSTNVSGSMNFSIPSDSVRQLIIYPAGNIPEVNGRFKSVNGHVIDYHVGYNFTNPLRIKAFSVSDTIVQKGMALQLYCLPENNASATVSFQWFQDNVQVATTTTGSYTWTAPGTPGVVQLTCKISVNGDTVTSTQVPVKVVDKIIPLPVISEISFSKDMPFDINSTLTASAILNTTDVTFSWSSVYGTLTNALTASPTWLLPGTPGIYTITLSISNTTGTTSFTKSVLVKDFTALPEPVPLIYYPFNEDAKNKAQNAFHAVSVGAVSTTGADGVINGAYGFPSSDSYIYTPNDSKLNFRDKITVSFWVKPDALPNSEQFIISHGSWEERYKISVIPNHKVRWTVKTNAATVDLDADSILYTGKYDHYTAAYTGYSMELYRNGKLSAFAAQNGLIQTTQKSITFGRKDEGTTLYNFVGAVDEVRIYDTELSPSLLKLLPATFKLKATGGDTVVLTVMKIVPNPFVNEFAVSLPTGETIGKKEVFDLLGKAIFLSADSSPTVQLTVPNGFYIVRITSGSGKQYKAKIIKKK